MKNLLAVSAECTELASGVFRLAIVAPQIAASVQPGQFINIKVGSKYQPLLRRPFSVHKVEADKIFILFNIVGEGTQYLANLTPGTTLDILGPLGNPFVLDNNFETALLVAGGLGVAPFPLFTQVHASSKRIVSFIGARSAPQIAAGDLLDVRIATDDGTAGFNGTVVELMRRTLNDEQFGTSRIFGCGPHPMLRALTRVAEEFDIPCEISLESPMACGIGICQGCPVEIVGGERKYALVCKDGTVFDSARVRI